MNFKELNSFIEKQIDNVDKGTSLEVFFAKIGKSYLEQALNSTFEYVKLWNELAWENKGKDIGADLVAKDKNGKYYPIQCKYRKYDNGRLSQNDIAKVLAILANTNYIDENNNKVEFEKAILVTNLDLNSLSYEITKDNNDLIIYSAENFENFKFEVDEQNLACKVKPNSKELRPYQKEAVDKVKEAFYPSDVDIEAVSKGKLVMACGTGKTFTSLKIGEALNAHTVLFLVPNLALLSQTMEEYNLFSSVKQNHLLVCGDADIISKKTQRKDSYDLNEQYYSTMAELPATSTNNPKEIANFLKNSLTNKTNPYVIFSTYQSVDKVHLALEQLDGFEFDLILADEAHRTTGINDKKSNWTQVTNNDWIARKKTLYMTATPRSYTPKVLNEASKENVEINSMDDNDGIKIYGTTIYSYKFKKAIKEDYLSDYKVVILTMDATPDMKADKNGYFKFIDNIESKAVQETLFNFFKATTIKESSKKIMIISADQIKNYSNADVSYRDEQATIVKNEDVLTKKDIINKIICFTNTVSNSDYLSETFNSKNRTEHKNIVTKLISGAMGSNAKKACLSWLKETDDDDSKIKILTNARCLTEGVDVPSVNSILFAEPKTSKIDVVQAVGRAIRKSINKNISYIILPVILPKDLTDDNSIDYALENTDYNKIWQVLQALRSHDTDMGNEIDALFQGETESREKKDREIEQLPLELWEAKLYAKILNKCGDNKYLDSWTSDIEALNNQTLQLIRKEYKENIEFESSVDEFLKYFQENINSNLKKDDLYNLLANQFITRPIFESLFSEKWYLETNPIYNGLEDLFSKMTFDKAYLTNELGDFYEQITERAKHIYVFEEKQNFLLSIYEGFLRKIDKDTATQYGLVYTPIEAVKFIVKAVNDVLDDDFNKSLLDDDLTVFDPFSGTGSFGIETMRFVWEEICSKIDNPTKAKEEFIKFYTNKLICAEIMLLPYYISCINIEYYFNTKTNLKQEFSGMTMVDTFTTYKEPKGRLKFKDENLRRIGRLQETQFTVILGNPPYNNDKNEANYDELESKLNQTYIANSKNKGLKGALYNDYFKAFRYASDKVKDRGVVAFITGNAFINSVACDGFRASLLKEFYKVYHLDLKGDGTGVLGKEERQRQADSIFGNESRSRAGITILVKDDAKLAANGGVGQLYLLQAEDYLKSHQKKQWLLSLAKQPLASLDWQLVRPDENNNWIGFGNSNYKKFVSLGSAEAKSGKEGAKATFFNIYSCGVMSSRDNWVVDFNQESLCQKMTTFINTYTNDVATKKMTKNMSLIKYTRDLVKHFTNKTPIVFDSHKLRLVNYRPFCKVWFYFDGLLNEELSQMESMYPFSLEQNWQNKAEPLNLTICTTGRGSGDFSCFIVSNTMERGYLSASQNFSLYRYAEYKVLEHEGDHSNIFTDINGKHYIRLSNINPVILQHASQLYLAPITADEIFYYVYALLHHPTYRTTYKNDLFKDIAKLPLIKTHASFMALVNFGRQLASIHLNYHSQPAPAEVTIQESLSAQNLPDKQKYYLTKLADKVKNNTLKYNDYITLTGIDYDSFKDYKLNGNDVIKLFANSYKFYEKGTKKAMASDPYPLDLDPNTFSQNSKYLLNLLLSIISTAQQSQVIVGKIGDIDIE